MGSLEGIVRWDRWRGSFDGIIGGDRWRGSVEWYDVKGSLEWRMVSPLMYALEYAVWLVGWNPPDHRYVRTSQIN